MVCWAAVMSAGSGGHCFGLHTHQAPPFATCGHLSFPRVGGWAPRGSLSSSATWWGGVWVNCGAFHARADGNSTSAPLPYAPAAGHTHLLCHDNRQLATHRGGPLACRAGT